MSSGGPTAWEASDAFFSRSSLRLAVLPFLAIPDPASGSRAPKGADAIEEVIGAAVPEIPEVYAAL